MESRAPLGRLTVDAFDADVLIYAAQPGHELGGRVRVLLESRGIDGRIAGVGSVLLLPEVLSRPRRDQSHEETFAMLRLLARLELLSVDLATAEMATEFGAAYRLRAADAIHLATAVKAGAERFVTNNRKDFPKTINEIAITYPNDLSA